jgi:aminoglycoside/choline kinase family phosphotransferase
MTEIEAVERDGLVADLAPSFAKVFPRAGSEWSLTRLRGDASTRIYYRVDFAPGHALPSLIVMRLPEDALRSDEGTSSAAPPELPFLNVHRFLSARGVRVPIVYASDVPRRVVLLEDLGDETFEARLKSAGSASKLDLYRSAVALLADMHARAAAPDPHCLAFTRAFDEKLLRWELEHFVEWGLDAPFGKSSPAQSEVISRAFDALARELAAVPPHFVHRDFQSRNLMWKDDALVVIDFQDALLGPAPYDLVALLCDSYVSLSAAEQETLIAHYLDARGVPADSRAEFTSLFWRVAAQRKLKDAGRFVFIDRVRRNPSFLVSFPQSLVYAGRALERVPALRDVHAILADRIPGFPNSVAVPAAVSG